MTYTEACAASATDQGLDPIAAALAKQGVPFSVDQTGGFCMCINVPLSEGGAHWLYMTSAHEAFGIDADATAVGEYWDCEALYGGEYHSEGTDHGLILFDDLRDLVTRLSRENADCLYGCGGRIDS